MKIITDTYKISSGEYMKTIMSQWFSHWWWIIAIPIAIQILLGLIHNIVFLYSAVISIFLILPPIALFLYYYYALTTEARISILNKYVEFHDNGINVIFESEQEEQSVLKPISFDIKNVSSVKFTEKHLLIMLNGNKYSNITIPYSVVSDEKQLQEIAILFNANGSN